jgi:hypothetical protein
MKRAFLLMIAVLMILGLTACSGEAYNKAYTASGDSNNPNGLTENDGRFGATDDLNVIVKLNTHRSEVEVEARFFGPEDAPLGEPLMVTADKDVGTVLLGLDWESRPDGQPWVAGSYKVEIYIDGKKVDTIRFGVA